MPSIETQTAAIVGMLAAATGAEPTTDETPRRVRIEATLPEPITPAARLAVLTALATADRYGHERTEQRSVVWVELDRETTR